MTEGREIAHRPEGAVAEQSEGAQRFSQTIAMIREALFNPDVDAAKAKVMADLMNGQEDRLLAAEFNRDLNAAIMEMPVITKAGIITIPAKDGNPERTQGRFARFEDIDRVVRPILQRHNLSIRFEVGESTQAVTVRPVIGHRNGHTERGSELRLPIDSSGAKNNTQGVGSAVTYGKRYTMCAALNIVTEGTDDDGSLGKLEIGMPHEREVTVLEQAEDAAQAGGYADWFVKQSPKDRAWLVKAGHHARLGGGLLLPGTEPPEGIERPQAAASGGRGGNGGAQRRQQQSGHDVNTPDGWTAQYEDDCRAAKDLDALQNVQQRGANAMRRLQKDHPTLHERAVKAGTDAHARLSGGEL